MKSFNENDQNLMVATKAFGMGIDKPNIRYTIHINHPSSIEVMFKRQVVVVVIRSMPYLMFYMIQQNSLNLL